MFSAGCSTSASIDMNSVLISESPALHSADLLTCKFFSYLLSGLYSLLLDEL